METTNLEKIIKLTLQTAFDNKQEKLTLSKAFDFLDAEFDKIYALVNAIDTVNLALVWSSVCGSKIEPSDINEEAIEEIKNEFDISSLTLSTQRSTTC